MYFSHGGGGGVERGKRTGDSQTVFRDIQRLDDLAPQILTCKPPLLQGANNQELCKRIVKGKFDCPSFMSAECRDLVRRMMNVDAVKRITISEIQQHAWCKGWFAKTERHDGTGKQIDCEASMDSLNGSDQIPVDDRVVDSVCQHGYNRKYVGKCVAKNLHNQCTATYWVLQQKRQAALQSAAGKD